MAWNYENSKTRSSEELLSESLEYVQHTAARILNAIGAGESPAPPV